jgi:hypothetical protein
MVSTISEFIGKTFSDITINEDKTQVVFETIDGEKYLMFHEQDCCETVSLNDITGEISDLIGSEILIAYESTNNTDERGLDEWHESFTWTFYNLATRKGYVTLKWLGESNGYYSESVEIEKIQ